VKARWMWPCLNFSKTPEFVTLHLPRDSTFAVHLRFAAGESAVAAQDQRGFLFDSSEWRKQLALTREFHDRFIIVDEKQCFQQRA
jgi:hypothetical protein